MKHIGRPKLPPATKETIINGCIIDPSTRCWNWNRAVGKNGRGVIRQGVTSAVTVYRIVWELWHGESPGKMHVCHTCDNPRCVNPEHLFLGTKSDNQRDSIEKGRWWKTPKRLARIKLSDPNARKEILESDLKYEELATMFNVSDTTVWRVKTGQYWPTNQHAQ